MYEIAGYGRSWLLNRVARILQSVAVVTQLTELRHTTEKREGSGMGVETMQQSVLQPE